MKFKKMNVKENKKDYVYIQGGEYTSVILHPFAAIGLFASRYLEVAERLDAVEALEFREKLDAADEAATTHHFLSILYKIKSLEIGVLLVVLLLAVVLGFSTTTVLGIIIVGKFVVFSFAAFGKFIVHYIRQEKMKDLHQYMKNRLL